MSTPTLPTDSTEALPDALPQGWHGIVNDCLHLSEPQHAPERYSAP